MVKQRPALRYHGGKWLLAKWIISHFPPHRVYVEPYGGAASVLIQKPRSKVEIYNELNPEIVEYFQVLRDPVSAGKLKRLLSLTPFARREFEDSYTITKEPIEQARRLVVRSFMGFGSAAPNRQHRTGFRVGNGRDGAAPATDWRNFPEAMDFLTDRLRGVCIESVPALDLIRARDGEDHLHYVDPPYVHETRKHRQQGNYGAFEMSDRDHVALSNVLKRAAGMVVVSGYDCPMYRELYPGWHRAEKHVHGNANCGAGARKEILWLNDRCVEGLGRSARTP